VSGAVAPVQRFGPALNLNIHFPMLVLDGAYLVGTKAPVFRRIAPPGEAELQALVERLAEHIGRALERKMPRAVFSSSPGIVLEPLDFIAPGGARTAAAHAPDEITECSLPTQRYDIELLLMRNVGPWLFGRWTLSRDGRIDRRQVGNLTLFGYGPYSTCRADNI
jgi:hypothetical protein